MKYLHFPRPEKEEKFYAAYGLFMHELLEKYYKGEITKSDALMRYLTQFLSKTSCSGMPKQSTVLKCFDRGADFLRSLHPLRFKPVSVEEKVEFKIGRFPFVGRIDYIGDDNGDLVIVDNKSRDLKKRSNRKKPTAKDIELDDMLKQLYIYSEAVRQKYGKLPKFLCFNCFKNGEFIEEPFNEKAYEEALEWAEKSIEYIMDVSDFRPKPEFFSCLYLCDVSRECCYLESADWNNRGGKM